MSINSTLFSFENINIDEGLMNEIWRFNPNTLDSLTDITVSKYSIALAQYLIYFTSERNKTKAIVAKKKMFLDSSLSIAMDKDILKRYSTKKDATAFIVSTNRDFAVIDQQIEDLQEELTRLDGMDKSISELIATFKRELTRREKELFAIRQERH